MAFPKMTPYIALHSISPIIRSLRSKSVPYNVRLCITRKIISGEETYRGFSFPWSHTSSSL
ncbi:unnamed protein product [Schistosoma curassoni]|uniref:Ovule protein n=1 Tax=Schistosoma curassoni TaxID=6186 RepID=A0A183JQY5_9TREM|nr:unnamed protein product [Schistosoma curassoni]